MLQITQITAADALLYNLRYDLLHSSYRFRRYYFANFREL